MCPAQLSQIMNLEILRNVGQAHRKESRGRPCIGYCDTLWHSVLRKAECVGKYLQRKFMLYLMF